MTEPLISEWISSDPNEPKFGLLAHDIDAPETIEFWVSRRRERLMKLKQGETRDKELKQCTEAEQVAWKMRDYQRGLAEADELKVPETMREDLKNSLHFARRVDNAVAESTEAIAYANQFGTLSPQFAHSVKHLKRFADYLRKLHGGR